MSAGNGMGYYNHSEGVEWEDNKPGWYEATVNIKHYFDVIDWLETNIGKYERHTRWHVFPDTIKLKFRYQRDCMMFLLRWS
jgi:hypothetical protein